jgi:hypothetical protein
VKYDATATKSNSSNDLSREMRRHDTYCSNFSCTPVTLAVGLRPGSLVVRPGLELCRKCRWNTLRFIHLRIHASEFEPELWSWSSVAIHRGTNQHDAFSALDAWRRHWTVTTWRGYLGKAEIESKLAVIRQRTHTGRPLGTAEFIQDLEKALQRQLALQK